MMEKYAVDLNQIPPTDDQLRTLKKLNGSLNVKTASEANDSINELLKGADCDE